MSKSKQTTEETNKEESNTYGTAKETHRVSYSEEREIHEVPNTPFTLIREKKEWMTVMGNYQLGRGFSTLEEALEDAKIITWNRILVVIGIILERKEAIINEVNNNKKQE